MPIPAAELRVDHPFLLRLVHRRLSPREMVEVSRVFDVEALGGDGRLRLGADRVEAERTVVRITPVRPMTYEEVAEEAEAILEELGPRAFGEVPVLERLDWLLAPQDAPAA